MTRPTLRQCTVVMSAPRVDVTVTVTRARLRRRKARGVLLLVARLLAGDRQSSILARYADVSDR